MSPSSLKSQILTPLSIEKLETFTTPRIKAFETLQLNNLTSEKGDLQG